MDMRREYAYAAQLEVVNLFYKFHPRLSAKAAQRYHRALIAVNRFGPSRVRAKAHCWQLNRNHEYFEYTMDLVLSCNAGCNRLRASS